MFRLLIPVLTGTLLIGGNATADQLPKSNADLEQEMAIDLRKRTADSESTDAREMRQVKESEPRR